MIDTLSIVSYSGVVLWERTSHQTGRRAMVNKLIQEVLLEDRAGLAHYSVDDYQLQWALENDAKFFVAAVYPKFFKPQHMHEFLRDIAITFAMKYGQRTAQQDYFSDTQGSSNDARATNLMEFNAEYAALHAKYNASDQATSQHIEEEAGEAVTSSGRSGAACEVSDSSSAQEDGEVDGAHGEHPQQPSAHNAGKVIMAKDGRRLTIGGGSNKGNAGGAPAAEASGSSKKRGKKPTKWDDPGAVHDPIVEKQLRQSKATEAELQAQTNIQREVYIKRLSSGAIAPVKEREWEGQSRGRLATWLRSYVGNREVDAEDLKNVIPGLREKLVAKNVAVEVAEQVCHSVEASLAGKRLGTFDSLYKTIEDAMTASLRRILQPKREVNILRDVAAAKALGKPYSIVLCGVNGVGKSTSLAKITYWLQQNGSSVLLAAGDTFRHGAVEQLGVHGRCLGVPVFHLGYGADPSAVAAAAMVQASKQRTDVVMIDTAGRMQDHESRMRALAKLIHDNQPDLVLFVGEALVGNNGIDQLRKFNQCLVDFAPVGAQSRGIDGIVLTKFDTIDDKVGAALSMVYELGQPIVFVGVGQTYQDLKVIEPEVVVSALMK